MTADELIDSYVADVVTLIDLALRTRRHHVRQAVEIRECPPLAG